MLPRPARLVRQHPALLVTRHRLFHTSPPSSATPTNDAPYARGTKVYPASSVHEPQPPLDHSYDAFLKDIHMHTRTKPSSRPERNVKPKEREQLEVLQHHDTPDESSASSSVLRLSDPDNDEYIERFERRSPAAILGSKRIGEVILPSSLHAAISDAVASVDRHGMRQQYLQQLHPRTSKRAQAVRTGATTRRLEKKRDRSSVAEELVARATTQVPRHYAAVRNVVEELDRRLGSGWIERATDRAWEAAKDMKETERAVAAEGEPVNTAEGTEDGAADILVGDDSSAQNARPAGIVEFSSTMAPGLW